MAMQAYHGGCHCGAVKFSFEAEPFTHGIRCNCSYCSKRGTMMHLVPADKFVIDAQPGALSTYQWGTGEASHHFCKTCGIHPFSETTRRPGQYIVNLGCVEEVDTFALETTVFDGKHLL
ncbi:MAG TPA: GFA family protein [Gallionellaceae bacterium]